MADIKISQLGAAIAVGDTDLVPIVSGGNTLKATAAQVKEHSIGNTNISSIGDGSVTGAINALNTDKQPKTLDTPLTIGGVSKTTVEAALDGLVSENQTLTNNVGTLTNLNTYSKTSVVNGINEANLKVSVSNDEYSSSKAYRVRDLVIHNGQLYCCTTACTAGSWATNASCFSSISLTSFVRGMSKIRYFSIEAPSGSTYYDFASEKPNDFSVPIAAISTGGAMASIGQMNSHAVYFTSTLQGSSIIRIVYEAT